MLYMTFTFDLGCCFCCLKLMAADRVYAALDICTVEMTLVSPGLLSLAVTCIVSADEMYYQQCYTVDSRNECFFYPLNWKTSWISAQKFCSDHDGTIVSIHSDEVFTRLCTAYFATVSYTTFGYKQK